MGKRERSGEKSGSALIFILSFVISFCILGSMFYIFFVYVNSRDAGVKQENIAYESDYHPKRSENLTLLLLGCDKPESLPGLTAVVHYSATQGVLSFAAVPPTAVVSLDGRSDTIAGHYDYEGTRGAVKAVEKLLGIEFNGCFRMQRSGIISLADFFGGLPFTVKEDKILDGQTIFKGEQLLDGRRIAALIFEKTKGVTNPKLQSELIGALLKKGMKPSLYDKYENFVDALFYNCETDLSRYDFLRRQTGFLNYIKADKLEVKWVFLQGRYNSDYSAFYPNETSLAETVELFK